MNEVFGEENFIATVLWQKVFAPKNTAMHFSEDHDYVTVYARDGEVWRPQLLPRSEETDSRYTNPDNDVRGNWASSDLTARNYYSEGQYEVTGPTGKRFKPTIGTYWRINYERFQELDTANRVWWGPDGENMPRLKRFLSEVKQGIVPQTMWFYKDVGHTQEAKQELLDLVHFENTENVLNTLKPSKLIQRMLQIATDVAGSDIVVDFFSGSAATAHAILKQNAEDGGNRIFVMVQLPELLPKREPLLGTIADIGKERIRRVIARMKEEREGQLDLSSRDTPEDLGFRVFKLASSHYRRWQGVSESDPEAYADQMGLFTDPLVEGWRPMDVLWEVAIKEGYRLDSRVEPVPEVTGQTVYRVSDPDGEGSFLICLDDKLDLANLHPLGLDRDTLFVCRDVALDDDAAANLALQCRLKTI